MDRSSFAMPRARHDGWTHQRQVAFLRALFLTRCVTAAASSVGMSREGAYRFRRRPLGRPFATAWDRMLAMPLPVIQPGHEGHTPIQSARPNVGSREGKGREGHAAPQNAPHCQPVHNLASTVRNFR